MGVETVVMRYHTCGIGRLIKGMANKNIDYCVRLDCIIIRNFESETTRLFNRRHFRISEEFLKYPPYI